MTWHTWTTTREHLDRLLAEIRGRGGTVAHFRRGAAGLVVTWFSN